MRIFHRAPAALILAVTAGFLPGCGDDATTTGPTVPAVSVPAGPDRATITAAQEGIGQLGFSPLPTHFFRIQFQARIQESAGLGANMNFVRLSFLKGGAEVERAEIGSDRIIQQLGSNRIAARATITPTFKMDFNEDDFDPIRLEFNFTDDRGNSHAPTLDDLQVVVFPGFIPAH